MTRYAHGAAQIMSVGRKAVTDMAKDSLTNFANVLYSGGQQSKNNRRRKSLRIKRKKPLIKRRLMRKRDITKKLRNMNQVLNMRSSWIFQGARLNCQRF